MRIRGDVRDGQAELVIDDDGPGIPGPERERGFERFYRVNPADETPGAGLGLSIVHRAVTANGGRLTFDDAPGGGLRVAIAFPAV